MIEQALSHEDDSLLAQAEELRAYWDRIDRDPDVARRREAIEEAENQSRVPEGTVDSSKPQ
jgi:hypothetical protein